MKYPYGKPGADSVIMFLVIIGCICAFLVVGILR